MARPLRSLLGAVLLVSGLVGVAGPAAGQTVEEPVILQTTLTGLREVAPDGSLGAGDPDGVGAATVQVTPTSVCARLNVSGVDLPAAAAHIHQARVGVNGPIVAPLAAPGADGLTDGCVDGPDPAVLAELLADPGGFYVNVHTTAFPDGAVRGQLQPAPEEGTLLATRLAGSEEVGPSGEPGVGDLDGSGIATVAVSTEARRACFELWVRGVALPAAAAHIHEAPLGVNGPIVVPLSAPDAAGQSRGCARGLDAAAVQALVDTPLRFYVNVHTTERPDGAVRGQLAPATGLAGNDDLYDDPATWVCRPDLPAEDNVCHNDLDATSVAADGTLTPQSHQVADPNDPPVDCFYVYPTVRLGDEGNAPFDGNYGEEIYTTRNQAGRFSRTCQVYAPLYRQFTINAPRGNGFDYGAVAYGDVVSAFRSFLADVGDERPFVLLGHSQGSSHLRRLIADVVDENPALRDRLLSALLLGTTVSVPVGGDVGGSFANVPACRAGGQTGCVISYASFRDTAPPPEDSFFGRSSEPGTEALCTNPADLTGGSGELTPYFDIAEGSQFAPANPRLAWDPAVTDPPPIATPFVSLPGLVSSQCANDGTHSYLALHVNPDPGPRVDDIGGDLSPEWGMHLVDVNVALENLIDLVAGQAQAWAVAH